MKLFKKALVASAVVGAFSAQAVTVSSDKVKISEEGLAVAKSVTIADQNVANDDFVLDFVVGALTPASSFIELTFSEGVDLGNINIASSSINNVVGSGVGTVDLNNTDPNAAVTFDYGTGSFTFDSISLTETEDKKQDVLSFKVNLGNPLVADSAFRLTIADIDGATSNGIILKGAEEVCYTSFENNSGEKGNVIETGCSTISEVQSQYAFSVSQEWDGKIERVDQQTFSRDADVGTDKNDTLKFSIVNNETLAAAITAADAEVELAGNFKDMTDAEFTANGSLNVHAVTISGKEDAINFTIADADLVTTATGTTKGYVEFNASGIGANLIPQTGAITATVEFTDGTDVFKKITDAAGQWALDATVINVPYFPVLYSGVVSTVHIANEGNEADIIVRAIDEYGMEHGPLDLGRDLGENKVERITAGELATLFGIDKKTKLSVTFNIDGYASDVSANATVQSSTGRSEVSNSQQKVDGK